MNNNAISYSEMVEALAKPGREILDSLTPEKAHLWHMVGELRGELLELEIATLNDDGENILEECGDMLFYLQGALMFFGMQEGFKRDSIKEGDDEQFTFDTLAAIRRQESEDEKFGSLSRCVDTLGTWMKRVVIYETRQPQDVAIRAIRLAVIHLGYFLSSFGSSLEKAFAANETKLSKRYASGTFSNQQAQQRADKLEGE